MKTNNAFEQIFHPLLTEFCAGKSSPSKLMTISRQYFCLIQMNNYSNAERKIFYFGRDTNGWLETGELIDLLKK